jgi:hypothetical protein
MVFYFVRFPAFCTPVVRLPITIAPSGLSPGCADEAEPLPAVAQPYAGCQSPVTGCSGWANSSRSSSSRSAGGGQLMSFPVGGLMTK